MRRFPPTLLPPTIFETFPRPPRRTTPDFGPLIHLTNKHTLASTTTRPSHNILLHHHQQQQQQQQPIHPSTPQTQHRTLITTTTTTTAPAAKMSTNPSSFAKYAILTPTTAFTSGQSGAQQLSAPQQLLVASVLDLFAGHPTKRKLTLWTDDASFHDPLTNAEGRKQFEAQWYGLKAAFSEIERLGCEVRSGGNPIELGLKTRYKVKGVGAEQTIESKVLIHTAPHNGDGGEAEEMRITKVEDRWDGEIKDGPVRNALRALNAKVVPIAVTVPASVDEEEGRGGGT